MKPGKTFKLSKTTKRIMALMGGTNEDRNHYKRMMIQAEMAASVVIKRESKDKGQNQK
jgi:hypothetical protein